YAISGKGQFGHGELLGSAGTSSTGTGNYSSGAGSARAWLATRCMGAICAKRRLNPSDLFRQIGAFRPCDADADHRLPGRSHPFGGRGRAPGLDTDPGAIGERGRDLPVAAALATDTIQTSQRLPAVRFPEPGFLPTMLGGQDGAREPGPA